MAKQIFTANTLTGGSAGSLDDIRHTIIDDGNTAICIISATNSVYHYTYDSTSAAAESSPDVIKPDSLGAANGAWLLCSNYGNIITGDIGITSDEIGNILQATSAIHYLGDGQELRLYYNGTHGWLTCTSGNMYISNTDATGDLVFSTDNTEQWRITETGTLQPGSGVIGAVDIGGPTREIGDIYQASDAYHYLGDDQTAYITQRLSTLALNFRNWGGYMTIGTNSAHTLSFYTDNTQRWGITSAGTLYPISDHNIGTTTYQVGHIYQGDGYKHYFGPSQDAEIYWDSLNSRLAVEGMVRYVCIVPFASDEAVTTGDGTIGFTIPTEFNGWELVSVRASVTTVGSSGTTDIQVRRYSTTGTSTDMLSTKVTISASQYSSADGVIYTTGNENVSPGYQLFIDVDAVSTGTEGLSVVLGLQKV